jgi:hypothetical protein
MTAQPALLVMPTAAELADTLTVANEGGDLPALAAACRTYAVDCPEPGRSRCLRAADMLELGARVLDALELVHASESVQGGPGGR